MTTKLHSTGIKLVLFVFITLFTITGFSQIEIASQRFHNGSQDYQYTIADKEEVWAPMSQTINTHVGTDDWDYTATTSNGIIRIVNSEITAPASDLYCLEIKNYWDDNPEIEFSEIDISNFNNVTFSIAYQSIGEPDNNEDLILDYMYFSGGTWVAPASVNLVDASNDLVTDIVLFGTSLSNPNPYVVSIPDSATRFRATVRASFINGTNGNDNYYLDDVILTGDALTIPPVANCASDFSIELDSNGLASITASDIDNGSSVSVGTMTLSIDKTDFTCADLGENIITLTVDDGIQSTTCTTTVTVNGYTGSMVTPTIPDTTTYCSYTAPTPEDISYQCHIITPTTTDETVFTTPGNYSITWTYYDSVSGTSETSIQNVTLNNLTAPTGIIASNIGADSATISWDEQVGVESYEIQYKKNDLTNWDSVTSTLNTVELTLLDQLTEYDVRVAAICDGTSTFSGVNNFTTDGHDYCVPEVTNFSNNDYIRRVRFGTLTPRIDNYSTYTNGYDDYTETDIANVYKNETYTITIDAYSRYNQNMGFAVWIDFNGDGDFEDVGEDVWRYEDYDNATTANTVTGSISIPTYAVNGQTVMRVATRRYWYPDDPCDGDFDGQRGEFEDYTLDLQIRPDAPQEIDITGNGNIIVDDAGVADIEEGNNTDFGPYDVYETPLIKTYRITNNGADPLTLTGSPLVEFINNTGDFTIIQQPNISVLAIGESTTFKVAFDPTTEGIKSATLQILNDDIDGSDTEDNYTFYIQGDAVKTFPDTDGDGVPDNIDGDDDNDGILDSAEDTTCKTYSVASQVESIFLNETFGSGYDRVEVDEYNDTAVTTYCYEDGTGSCNNGDVNLNDGSYTVYHNSTSDIASWSDSHWYQGLDHTDDAIDGAEPGRMLIINASYDPGIFYSATINGVTPGVEVTYGFSVINLDRTDAPCIDGCPGGATWDDNPRKRPEVLIAVYDQNGNSLIPTTTSGLIEPTDVSNPNGDWYEVSTTFTTTSSQFTVQLINSQDGGAGNDLAIDDIYVKQLLCDMDGDGVADTVDLDNDDDGIPNVVELNLPDSDQDGTLFGDGWLDTNNNGVHDLYEGGAVLLDSDNDGVPNYIDLDSDNDGIFDTVEYDGNGDIDIDGDGLGDGNDGASETNDDTLDGDGILAIVDTNDNDVDGSDHGTNGYELPLDSDGDGIPNYLDPYNDIIRIYDIDNTIYGDIIPNFNGVISGSTDADLDGILDVFDTDNTVFGSPRDLNDSYTLFFDGRNDYVEDANVLVSGDATLMAFIRSNGDNDTNTDRIIVGQDNFYLKVNDSDNTVSIVLNGSTVFTSTTTIVDGIWTHIAASTDSEETILYINGEIEGDSETRGISNDTSRFTIGRLAGRDSNYFNGEIDEVRLFQSVLTEEEIQKMVYQELGNDDDSSFNFGKTVPVEISSNLNATLLRYFKMDGYKGDILDDKTTGAIDFGTGAKLYNIKDIYFQTAPLPYETVGDLSAETDWYDTSIWKYGSVWDITSKIEDNLDTEYNHSIVKINGTDQIKSDVHQSMLGLIVEPNAKLTMDGDTDAGTGSGVFNTWYLKLDGTLDLQGESQLIQTSTSMFDDSSVGQIERDQQGTANSFAYNYWSSPVYNSIDDDGDKAYNLMDVLFDGSDVSTPIALDFDPALTLSAADPYYADGAESTPRKIATYWFWKFVNSGNDYANWTWAGGDNKLKASEGFSMKGVSGANEITADQNYVFIGKPNNAPENLGEEIIHTTFAGGTTDEGWTYNSLTGNPFPSALDADKFINDNLATTTGTIYFWEHWGGNNHNWRDYQAGYSTYTIATGVPAVAHTDGSGIGAGTKAPGRYIPVGQAFYVIGSDAGGDVVFKNSQRVFKVELNDETNDDHSVFTRGVQTENKSEENTGRQESGSGEKQIIRLGFDSPYGYHRQIAVAFLDGATDAFDPGYDAEAGDYLTNDAFFTLDDKYLVIQAFVEFDEDREIPISIFIDEEHNGGLERIMIDGLKNIPETTNIYIKDNFSGETHDIKNNVFEVNLESGEHKDRFSLVFKQQEALSVVQDTLLESQLSIVMNNSNSTIDIKKPIEVEIESVILYNSLGQTIQMWNKNFNQNEINLQLNSTSTGAYIVKINTDNNTLSKKIIIE
ncbi:LamG-like jellyroll fold domain-containing protein [Urechidicola croceus]|uniref:Fibronectin type-III domain-containing protein n=1 Tax=Urechidicola croceus TaxID=1850246 RepID=A0A1D8P9A7_9FLAO|nr:LamG-like jellyroll fold domain-containing protein [Urechidicola croceus]AOW21143.1 hypothetical protein LPB138_10840 [Urechidicola croceus]